jgi:hypothetical protein
MFTAALRHKWQKTLAIALGGLGMATSSVAHGAGSEAQWDKALNDSWQALSPKQKQELRQDEREWIKWQNSLPPEPGRNATKNRALYIQKVQSGEKVDPKYGWNVRPNFDYPSGKLNPHDAQELIDDINAEATPAEQAALAKKAPTALYSNEQATQLINALQQTKNKPPVRSGVTYDTKNDTYNWIGPEKGRSMSSPRVEFEQDVGPTAYRLGIKPAGATQAPAAQPEKEEQGFRREETPAFFAQNAPTPAPDAGQASSAKPTLARGSLPTTWQKLIVQGPAGFANLHKSTESSAPVIARVTNGEEVTVLGRFPGSSAYVGDYYKVKTSAGFGYISSQCLTASELPPASTIYQYGPNAPAKEQLDTKDAGQQFVVLDPNGQGIAAYSNPSTSEEFSSSDFLRNGEQVTVIGKVTAPAADPSRQDQIRLKPGEEWLKAKTSAGERYVLGSSLTTPDKYAAYQKQQEEIRKAQAAQAQQRAAEQQKQQQAQQQQFQARIEAIKEILQNPSQADRDAYKSGYRNGERFFFENSNEAWGYGDSMFIAAFQHLVLHPYANQQQRDSWCAGFVKAMRDNY